MTRQELNARLPVIIEKAKFMLANQAPVRTGNLKASVKANKQNNSYVIYIDEAQAPYAVYTNETWSKGDNPNEDWFNDGVELVIKMLQHELGGVSYKNVKAKDGE